MTPILAQRPRADRAFERMYRRHLGDVYRYALAVMRNQPDAEDVTQTTFMNAYRAFQRGERPEKPQNWLIAIAHNVCRQRFRQSARRPIEVSFDDDIGDRLVGADEEETPTAEDIRRALGQLAFNQRAALVMRELEGRSYAEIAEILELSPSAVETVIFRARRALREQLETTLTCGEAELAISRQLDGRLPRQDRGALRAHLRACKECATFARRQRAQRTALRSLGVVTVPSSLTSLFGGGGAAVGTGLAAKAAVVVTAGVVLGGAGYEGVHRVVARHPHHPAARSAQVRSSAHASARSAVAGVAGGQGRVTPAEASPGLRKHGPGKKAAHGRGYAGDASVAARHVHGQKSRSVVHSNKASRAKHGTGGIPSRVKTTKSAKTVPLARSKPHTNKPPVQLPGPYDGGPLPETPPGNGHGGGKP
jgi:RNA polymerase sigma factor (sigma-70 family)